MWEGGHDFMLRRSPEEVAQLGAPVLHAYGIGDVGDFAPEAHELGVMLKKLMTDEDGRLSARAIPYLEALERASLLGDEGFVQVALAQWAVTMWLLLGAPLT